MEKHLLEKMVGNGLSGNAIAKQTGKSLTTVWYWLRKHELTTKKVYSCRFCRDPDPTHYFAGRFSECRKCRQKDQNKSNRKKKFLLVQYKGGRCEVCGYNRCMAALDFHHIEPTQKDPDWKKMRKWALERIKKEIDQCSLVCRNCHSEIHYGNNLEQGVV